MYEPAIWAEIIELRERCGDQRRRLDLLTAENTALRTRTEARTVNDEARGLKAENARLRRQLSNLSDAMRRLQA